MTTTGGTAADTEAARVRLDRHVLLGNLVSGAVLLSPLALFGSWILLLIGAAYVVAAGVFLAAVYAQAGLTRRREALAWIAPWLLAVALWAVLALAVSGENNGAHYLAGLYAGLLVGTGCYLVWQLVALAVRQVLAWRSGRSSLPA